MCKYINLFFIPINIYLKQFKLIHIYCILITMAPKIIKKSETQADVTSELVKPKRGRKSKKELMASLNMEMIVKDVGVKDKDVIKSQNNDICLSVNEIKNDICNELNDISNVYETVLDENVDDVISREIVIISKQDTYDEKPAVKKRGRKPKGGKIIQQVVSTDSHKEDKPNVILHLKCSMKDLQLASQNNGTVESYNFLGGKNSSSYEILANEKTETFNNNTTISNLDNDYSSTYDCEGEADYDNDYICKDVNKDIWKKIKQLEHNLHINNVNNKRSACFWDTCEFDNPPIYIPKHFINGTYHVYGCFCSPECGAAYLMNENIDSSTKFERYHLFNHIYAKIYDYKKNIKPAPNPYYMLEKYYGNLSIQEYRSLLRNERLFLIVDKPLTRILPELHEDNDDFILNNKIIPSNNYHVKTRLQRKKQNKTSILNEKFGLTNQTVLE